MQRSALLTAFVTLLTACMNEREFVDDAPNAVTSATPTAASSMTGMVSGRVIGPDGTPLGGAFVQTSFPGDASWNGDLYDTHVAATRTRDDGSFELGPFAFAELARLRDIVDRRAAEIGADVLPSSIDGLFQLVARAPELRQASVRVDGPSHGLELRLARPTTLHVRAVPNGSSSPVVAHFALATRPHGWQLVEPTRLLEHPDIEPTRWRALAWTDDDWIGLSPWFELAEGQRRELVVELHPACTVRVEPWPGDEHAWARVLADGMPLWREITSDPTPGTFHCPAGTVELEVGWKSREKPRQRFELELAPGETRVVQLTP